MGVRESAPDGGVAVTLDTHIPAAVDRVEAERPAVARKVDAYASFLERVDGLGIDEGGPTAGGPGVTGRGGPTLAAAGGGPSAGGGGVAASLRDAFAETVGTVVDEGSTVEAIAAELGEEVGVALAPTAATPAPSQVVAGVTDAATERRWQLRAMAAALDREASSLSAALADVTAVREWVREADRTPLSDLGFADLRERHDRLGEFRARCEERLAERQAFLGRSTSANARIGLEHRPLVEYLYEDLPVDYPALDGVACAVGTCRQCQRVVRAHLTRSA